MSEKIVTLNEEVIKGGNPGTYTRERGRNACFPTNCPV